MIKKLIGLKIILILENIKQIINKVDLKNEKLKSPTYRRKNKGYSIFGNKMKNTEL